MISCQKKEGDLLKRNKIELISDIINSQNALPPPPPFSKDSIMSWEIDQKTIDSVLGIRLNIAIYPILGKPKIEKKVDLKDIDVEFKDLVNNFLKIETSNEIHIKEINEKTKHNVLLADTLILKKSKDWKEYDLLLNISNISFNKSFDKAALTMGISRSALWGAGGLYLFKKDTDKDWKIVKHIELAKW